MSRDGPYREYISIEGVQVGQDIDAGIRKGSHAVFVVL